MIVVGDVLRIPAAINFLRHGLHRHTRIDAKHEPGRFRHERVERTLAEARHLLPGDGAEAAVVGSAVHEVPPVSHRRGGELREEEHGAADGCDCKIRIIGMSSTSERDDFFRMREPNPIITSPMTMST